MLPAGATPAGSFCSRNSVGSVRKEKSIVKTLKEVTEGRKLRAMPPKFGKGNGPWAPREWSLRKAGNDYLNSFSAWSRVRWETSPDLRARAVARRVDQLHKALVLYTGSVEFADRVIATPAYLYPDAQEVAA